MYERCKKDFFFSCVIFFFLFLFYPSFSLSLSSFRPIFFFLLSSYYSLLLLLTRLLERRCLVNPTRKNRRSSSLLLNNVRRRYNVLHLLHSARRLSFCLFSSPVPFSSFFHSFVFFFSIDERRKCGSILSYTELRERISLFSSILFLFSTRNFFLLSIFLFVSWSHVRRSPRGFDL